MISVPHTVQYLLGVSLIRLAEMQKTHKLLGDRTSILHADITFYFILTHQEALSE